MEIELDNELADHYCFYAALLILKIVVLSPLTGLVRSRNKSLISPEDAYFMPNAEPADVKLALEPNENVERVRRCHRNDLEACFNFLIIYAVRLYLTGEASTLAMPAYVLARYLHTICYVCSIPQPGRAITNSVCNFAHWFMLLSCLYHSMK